jgi:pyruvate/2-oxoglutarate dehydrogenase complex dihydrolipoamide acyltransferase (E2) component
MDRIGHYVEKPFSKQRKNIVLITKEGFRKRSIHAVVEIDVTLAHLFMKKYREQQGAAISFTGWIVKCVGQAISEHKDLNSYRQGGRKIVTFDDVDIAIPVERQVSGESRPMVYILRRANEKSVMDITKEIRAVQGEDVDESTQLLGKNLTTTERFVLNAPMIIKKLVIFLVRRNGLLKKKYMGTVGVTAIGMKGRFPGWIIPLGGSTATLVTVGGISQKPGVHQDAIEIRKYLHMTVTVDHDIVDGGPLARFIDRLNELMETGYGLPQEKNHAE